MLNSAGRAGEIALPDRVAGIGLAAPDAARAATSGRCGEPARHRQPGFLLMRSRTPWCAARAAPGTRLPGRRRSPWRRRSPAGLPAPLVRGDEAEQQVGMAAEIFGAGLDRDVDALSCGGKKSGVAQVLSISTTTPRACATSAMAGMSCISKDSEPGASVNTAVVLGRISSAMSGADQRDRSRSSRHRSA